MALTGMEHMTPYELGESALEDAIPYLIHYLQIGSSGEARLAASAIRKLTRLYRRRCDQAVPAMIDRFKEGGFPQTRQYILKALLAFRIPPAALPLARKIANSDDKDYNRKLAEELLLRNTEPITRVPKGTHIQI